MTSFQLRHFACHKIAICDCDNGCVLFQRPGPEPGPGPGPAVLFRGPRRPGRPKVGPAVGFGRYRPRPRPALFVFANGVGKRCAR